MSKKLEEAGELILDKVLQYAQNAEEFVVREAPQYVKEFLEYEAFYHQQWVTWGSIPFILFLAITVALSCLKKKDPEESFSACLGAIFFLFVAIMTVPHSWMKLNKIKLAPRVYIIDSLRK